MTIGNVQVLGRFRDGFSFSWCPRSFVAWWGLGFDQAHPFSCFISSVNVRPGHQVWHVFTSFVVEMFRQLFHQILQVEVGISIVGTGSFNQGEDRCHGFCSLYRETEQTVAAIPMEIFIGCVISVTGYSRQRMIR